MKYVAAALLAGLGGKSTDASNINSILASVGIEAESDKINLVVKELTGKDIEQLIAEGQTKLASMPIRGSYGSTTADGGSVAPTANACYKEEMEEELEEKDGCEDDMYYHLFD